MPRALSSLLLLLMACDHARGRLDEAGVALRHGMFATDPERFGEVGGLGVLMSGAGDCAEYTALDEAMFAAEEDGAWAGAWAAAMPEDFWELRLIVLTDASGWGTPTLNPWDAAPAEIGEARAELIHYTQWPDEESWAAGDGWASAWVNDGGTLALEESRGGALKGTLEAPFVDGTGREQGEVRIRIGAEPCELGGVFEPDYRRF